MYRKNNSNCCDTWNCVVLKQLECMWDFNYYMHIPRCIGGDKAEGIWGKKPHITTDYLIFSLIQDNRINLSLL